MDNAVLAELLLPTVSVKVEPPTEMDPVPELVLVVGVNVAVYEVPLPEKLLIDPPDTLTSVEMKFAEDSESVNVIVSVSPDFNEPDPARVMVTVGARVS
jgi:hypothetical protein